VAIGKGKNFIRIRPPADRRQDMNARSATTNFPKSGEIVHEQQLNLSI
jgi:hypothetical protein